MGGTASPDFIPASQFKPDAGPEEAQAGAPPPDFIPKHQFVSDEDKYGGVGGSIKAGALGLARGLTLGGSDVLLTKGLPKSLAMKPETLKGFEETNPISSILGEGLSVVAPGGPAALIGKAGKAVYGATKALTAFKTAANVSTAAKVLGATADIGAHALGSAVEGGIYAGIGNSMHEYALGDPTLNGEKILANFGNGALWGGAIGAGAKTLAIGAPPAIKAAAGAVKKLRDVLVGTGVDGSSGLVGKISPELGDALGNRVSSLDVDGKMKLAKEATSALGEVHANLETSLKTLNKEIRPQEVDALINSADKTKAMEFRETFLSNLDNAVKEMEQYPERYSKSMVGEARDIHALASKSPTFDAKDAFKFLRESKQKLGDIIKTTSKAATREELKTVSLLQGVRGELDKGLKNPEIFGDVGSRLAAHDDILHGYYKFISPNAVSNRGATDFQKFFGEFRNGKWVPDIVKMERVFKKGDSVDGQKKMGMLKEYLEYVKDIPQHIDETYKSVPTPRLGSPKLKDIMENSRSSIEGSHEKYVKSIKDSKSALGWKDTAAGLLALSHPVLGAMAQAYNIYKNPIEYASKLANIERMVGQTTAKVGNTAQKIFAPTLKGVDKVKGALSREFSKDSELEDYKKNREELGVMMSNPDHLADTLHASTQEIFDTAPDITSSLQQASVRGLQFLNSKLPVVPERGPFDGEYEPPMSQIAEFNRYKDLVDNPMLALDHIEDRTLGPEDVETLTAVYPALYEEMKQALLNEAAAKLQSKTPIPYQTKQMVSFFIGQPLDESLTPTSIMANQAAMTRPPPVQPNGAQGGRTRKADVTIASRTGLHGEDKDA